MSERKIPRSSAAAVACLPTVSKHRAKMSSSEFPKIDTTGGIRQSDPSGLSSMQNAKMDTPRVATGGIIRSDPSARSGSTIQNAESQPFVAKVRRESTSNGLKSDPSTPVLRTGADGCMVNGVRAGLSTAKVSQSTLRTGADGRTMVSGIRAKMSGAKVSHLNDEPRLDRKIAEHCGVGYTTVADVRRGTTARNGQSNSSTPALRTGADGRTMVSGIRAKMSGSEIPNLTDQRRLDHKIAEHCGVGYTTVADVQKGASARNGQMDSPRVATRNGVDRKIAEHCGVSDKTVAAQRAKMSSGEIPQIAPSRVATRNGVEYCGVDHKTVAAQRAKASTWEIPKSTLRTGADGRMVNGVRAGLSSARVSQIDTPRSPSGGIIQIDTPCVATSEFPKSTLRTDARRESSSGGIRQIDTPRVATRKIAAHCGVGNRFVGDVRRALSLSGTKMDTPRVATRKIAEHCGVSNTMVSGIRLKMSTVKVLQSDEAAPVLRTGADGRTMVSGIRAKVSGAEIPHLNDGPRLDRKIAEHCGVHHDTVAAQRAKASPGGIRHLNDEPRLGRDGATP